MKFTIASRSFVTFAAFLALSVGAFALPSSAMADGTFAWPTTGTYTTSNTVPTYSNPTTGTKTGGSSFTPGTGNKTSGYSGYKPSGCSYSCGGYSYGGYSSSARDLYMDLSFDFSDRSVTNNSTINQTNNTNINVNGDNNQVGVNNNNNANNNQSGMISDHSSASRDAYLNHWRNQNNNGAGNSNGNGNGNSNDNNQVINFGDYNTNTDDDDDKPRPPKPPHNDDTDLACKIDASDTRVEEDDRITLEWDTRDAVRASINNGIGRVDEDGGSVRVRVDEDVTYRMTVEDENGDEEDCSVSIRVDEEERDRNNFSSIVIDDEPVVPPTNTYSGVYLSDIPYTGLDLGEYAWAYYAAIAGLGAAGAYFLFFMGIPFALRHAGVTLSEVENELALEEKEEATQILKSTIAAPLAITTSGATVISSQSEIENFVEALADADNDTASDILENATKNGASASVFLNRASAFLRAHTEKFEASVIETLTASLETAAKARA